MRKNGHAKAGNPRAGGGFLRGCGVSSPTELATSLSHVNGTAEVLIERSRKFSQDTFLQVRLCAYPCGTHKSCPKSTIHWYEVSRCLHDGKKCFESSIYSAPDGSQH